MNRATLVALPLLLTAVAAAAPATAKGPSRPDLKVTDVTFSSADRTLSISDVTRNAGRAVAKASVVRHYLSADETRDANDTALTQRSVPRLRARARSRGTVSVAIPAVAAASYRVIACADARRAVRETSERNNCRASGGTVVVQAPAGVAPPTGTPSPSPAPEPVATAAPTPAPTAAPSPAALRLGQEAIKLAPAAPAVTSADFTLTSALPLVDAFSATTLDASGAPMADVTAATVFSISPDGTCDGATCGSAKPGEHVITGTHGGLQDTVPVLVEDYASSYSMTCRGEHYDVNGGLGDGCEALQSRPSSATQSTATRLANATDCDDSGGTVSGVLHSDARAHANPAVAGFAPDTGSAPAWFRLSVTDIYGCQMEHSVKVTTTGGAAGSGCYKLTVSWWHKWGGTVGDSSIVFDGHGGGTMTGDGPGNGPESDDSADVWLKIEKICSTATTESVAYTLNYHF